MKLGRVVLFSRKEKVNLRTAINNFITARGIYSRDVYLMSSIGLDSVHTLFLNFIPFFLKQNHFNQFYANVPTIALSEWRKGKTFPIVTPETQMKKQQEEENIKSKYLRKKLAPLTVYSRHPSHDELRELHISVRALIRLGSTTDKASKFPRLEINSVEAVQNSASKIRMKNAFQKAGIITASWCAPATLEELNTFFSTFEKDCKFVTKSQFGSRGEGNQLHENAESVRQFFTRNRYGNYVVEKFMTHSKEYRLHVDKYGNCFYACRKVHLKDTAESDRWYRNDKNCNWIIESNPLFEKPATWDLIAKECVKALNAVGLHVGAVDVKVNKKGEFFILETNSAPSFGDLTLQKYQEQIPVILNNMLQEEASLTKNI
jgi:glutathione synthase/RimK-type ligase-like ATP-grasp enzyme